MVPDQFEGSRSPLLLVTFQVYLKYKGGCLGVLTLGVFVFFLLMLLLSVPDGLAD